MLAETVICLDDQIEGAVNFRDLGGYSTADGAARVRPGKVFRSAMSHHISGEGLAALAQRHGLRTVIDLRSDEEIKDGVAPFEAVGITRHYNPVFASVSVSLELREQRLVEMRSGQYDWVSSYMRMATDGSESLRRSFDLLATPGALPAMFHCVGGRDRTGVLAALVLTAVGVDHDTAATDYALTGRYLRHHIDRFMPTAERMTMTRDEMANLLETKHDHMLAFLTLLTEQHGSIPGYLRGIGVSDDALAALRGALLEPVA